MSNTVLSVRSGLRSFTPSSLKWLADRYPNLGTDFWILLFSITSLVALRPLGCVGCSSLEQTCRSMKLITHFHLRPKPKMQCFSSTPPCAFTSCFWQEPRLTFTVLTYPLLAKFVHILTILPWVSTAGSSGPRTMRLVSNKWNRYPSSSACAAPEKSIQNWRCDEQLLKTSFRNAV